MPLSKLVKTSLSVALLKADVARSFLICVESGRIQKWGNDITGLQTNRIYCPSLV